MNNPSPKYICTNPACESYYDTSLTEFSQDEVISGASSETCCPKCGLNLTMLDFYLEEKKNEKVKKQKRLIINLVSGVIIVVLIIYAFFLFTGKKHSDLKSQQIIHQTKDSVTKAPAEKPVEEKVQAPVKQEPALAKPIVKESVKPKTTASAAPKGRQTKTFSDGSKYVGEMKNGKMDGLGTYYYNSEQLISDRDLKKRVASKGDYVTGEWYEGRLVNGKQFDAENNQKAVIIIGR